MPFHICILSQTQNIKTQELLNSKQILEILSLVFLNNYILSYNNIQLMDRYLVLLEGTLYDCISLYIMTFIHHI